MQYFPGDWPASGPGMARLGSAFREKSGPKARHSVIDDLIDRIACCPWPATSGSDPLGRFAPAEAPRPLYTAEERRRRDATAWTTVQGVLAPIQFAVFLVSLGLVLNYLVTGHGYAAATASIILKTAILYVIMLTGSIWEKKVFDKFLFAQSFFWEDLVSLWVLVLHTGYLVGLLTGHASARQLMLLTLAAYFTYAVNATQFLLKLRSARREVSGVAHLSAGSAK
jgi:3-vinyl bacteriochlorophyllide hydratase